MKYVVYGLLLLLYALHTDVWYWTDERIVLGLPIGVTYHVLWTFLVSGAYWLVVQVAWPTELEDNAEGRFSAANGEHRVADDNATARP